MRETWVDDVLGESPDVDPGFRSRLEATIVDEWRAAPLIDLEGESDGGDDDTTGRGGGRRGWLVGASIAAAAVLAITSVAVLRSDDDTDPPTQANPAPTPSTTPSMEVIFVRATGGEHLTIEPLPGVEPSDLAGWRSVTATQGWFSVLVQQEQTTAVINVSAEGELSSPLELDEPDRRFDAVEIHRPPSSRAMYASWYRPQAMRLEVASYRPSKLGYAMVDRASVPVSSIERWPTTRVIALDEGLFVAGELVLETPIRVPPAGPVVHLDRDASSGVYTVTSRSTDGSTRSWDVMLERPIGSDFLTDVNVRPAGLGAVLTQSYRQSGEVRTNIVLLRPGGSSSSGFLRNWFVANADTTGVMLWSPRTDGVALATADWPDN